MLVCRVSRPSVILTFSLLGLITLPFIFWTLMALMHEPFEMGRLLNLAVMALIWYPILRIPLEIRWVESSLEFRGAIGSTKIAVMDLVSIKKAWFYGARVRHTHGSFELYPRMTHFGELLERVKAINPKVEIKGF